MCCVLWSWRTCWLHRRGARRASRASRAYCRTAYVMTDPSNSQRDNAFETHSNTSPSTTTGSGPPGGALQHPPSTSIDQLQALTGISPEAPGPTQSAHLNTNRAWRAYTHQVTVFYCVRSVKPFTVSRPTTLPIHMLHAHSMRDTPVTQIHTIVHVLHTHTCEMRP